MNKLTLAVMLASAWLQATPQTAGVGGVVSGRVLDSNGRPVPGIEVIAHVLGYRHDGRRELSAALPARRAARPTDDRGEYRLFDLPPGDYLISATASTGGYSRTFFPSALDPGSARAVRVATESEATADILIPSVRTVRVSGTVINTIPDLTRSAGAPSSLDLIPVAAHAVEAAPPRFRNLVVAEERSGGRFEIDGVLPGTYDLFATAPSVWSNIFHGRTRIEVGDKDLENVTVPIQKGTEVRISLAFDGGPSSAPPPSISPLLLPQENNTVVFSLAMMRPGEPFAPRRRAGEPAPEPLPLTDSKGAFLYSAVAQGNYIVQIVGLPENAYVARMRVGGEANENGKLIVANSPLNVELAINTKGSLIEGHVLGGAANAFVALIPQGARHDNIALYRSASTNTSGDFSIRGVAPGQYKLVAWQSIPPNAHLNPEFLSRYEPEAQIIRVTEGKDESSVSVSLSNR